MLRCSEERAFYNGELTGLALTDSWSNPSYKVPVFRVLMKNRSKNLRLLRILDGHIIAMT